MSLNRLRAQRECSTLKVKNFGRARSRAAAGKILHLEGFELAKPRLGLIAKDEVRGQLAAANVSSSDESGQSDAIALEVLGAHCLERVINCPADFIQAPSRDRGQVPAGTRVMVHAIFNGGWRESPSAQAGPFHRIGE